MFVILTYDVNVKRVKKVKSVCSGYLFHVQNSVFEGSLTNAQLESLKSSLSKTIVKEKDSICIYKFPAIKYATKDQIGVISDNNDNIID